MIIPRRRDFQSADDRDLVDPFSHRGGVDEL